MKKVVQKRITRVVQPEIAEYYCDRCGKRCGTRENRKSTWYGPRAVGDSHYCLKTCHPYDHPIWVREHVLNCEWCYRDAQARGDTWMAEALLEKMRGEP